MNTTFKQGDKVIAYIPGNNPKRGILTDKADGFGWGFYRVACEIGGETIYLTTTRIEHDKESN